MWSCLSLSLSLSLPITIKVKRLMPRNTPTVWMHVAYNYLGTSSTFCFRLPPLFTFSPFPTPYCFFSTFHSRGKVIICCNRLFDQFTILKKNIYQNTTVSKLFTPYTTFCTFLTLFNIFFGMTGGAVGRGVRTVATHWEMSVGRGSTDTATHLKFFFFVS